MESKHDIYRGKNCIKKFYESWRQHAMDITNFKKKKIKLLLSEQQKSCGNAKNFYICQEKIEEKHA